VDRSTPPEDDPPVPPDPPDPPGDESDGTVTRWIGELKAGDGRALQPLWDRYFEQLARMIRARLCAVRSPTAVSDEEDVAASVIRALDSGIRAGRFPRLDDRDDLWRVMAHLTRCKLIDRHRRDHAEKNPDPRTISEAEMIASASDSSDGGNPLDRLLAAGPTPDLAAEMAEELCLRLDALKRPDLRRIAELKLMGYTNPEIARDLGCALRTVGLKLELIRKTWQRDGTPS
jgi:DNA-directed RNA polymerase specialized sigma24 family protein